MLSKSCRLSLWGYPGWYRIMMLPPCHPWNLSLKCSPTGSPVGPLHPCSRKLIPMLLSVIHGGPKHSLVCFWVVPFEVCFFWGWEPGRGKHRQEALHKLVTSAKTVQGCFGFCFFFNPDAAWQTIIGAGKEQIPLIFAKSKFAKSNSLNFNLFPLITCLYSRSKTFCRHASWLLEGKSGLKSNTRLLI